MEIQKTRIWQCRDVTLPLDKKTLIMGIVNITPDSFSDGGKFLSPDTAIEQALRLEADGADIIDLGAESSRPGAEPVSLRDEMERLVPVVEALVGKIHIPISIDTYKSEIADEMLGRGVHIINDISGLHFDTQLKNVVAKYQAGLVVMHIKGTPKDMQTHPTYTNLMSEILTYLEEGIAKAQSVGLPRENIVVDPGIGFGKRLQDNFDILRQLDSLVHLDCPILIGPSRKSFIGNVLDLPPVERLEGTAAAVAIGIANGADIVRVHDVKEIARVCMIADRIIDKGRINNQ